MTIDVIDNMALDPPHLVLQVYPKKKDNKVKAVPLIHRDHPSNACWLILRLLALDPVLDSQKASAPLCRNPRTDDPIPTATWCELVRLVASHLGWDPALFGAHSMRIGGAHLLFNAGFSMEVIMHMGRWDSDIAQVHVMLARLRMATDAAASAFAVED